VTSWSELAGKVDAMAAVLRHAGAEQGSRVGCLLPNRPDYLVTFWAALQIGAVFVPFNVRLTAPELVVLLDDSDPVVVASDRSFAGVRQQVDATRPTAWIDVDERHPVGEPEGGSHEDLAVWLTDDDPAALVYTSGTTGRSKGALLSHGNLVHNSVAWTSTFALTRDDRIINLMPLCYVAGLLNGTLNVLQTGGSMVLEPRFDPASALRLIEAHRVTWFMATPQIVEDLITHPDAAGTDLSSLTRIQTGGAPVPVHLAERAKRLGVDLVQGFGMTEASGGINLVLPVEHALRKAGAIGKAAPFNAVRIVDGDGQDVGEGVVGEMLLRGPMVMKGYWQDEAATRAALRDGWLHTGDLASRDDEGFVTLVGRTKDVIITGGLNVYPVEVERVIETFDEVDEVAVVGLPDERWGERVTAFVVPAPGRTVSPEELRARCRDRLADYRIPKQVVVVPHFPRTASGKVRKIELRETYLGATRRLSDG
jgi:fatty-acyl-CoA synthase